MAEQDWLQTPVPAEVAGTAWGGKPAARFELRPLNLGEVLDRTFSLYRSHFWLFAGISMIAAAVNVIGQAISLSMVKEVASHVALNAPPGSNPAAAIMRLPGLRAATASSYLIGLLFLLVSAVTQAATARAMGEVYQHRATTVEQALGGVARRWYRWIGIALWQGFSLVWIPLLAVALSVVILRFGTRGGNVGLSLIGGVMLALAVFAGLPAGVVLYLRNALAVPAAVIEGLSLRPAMRRSKSLAAGAKGRIFVVLLIALCLLEVVAVVQSPVSFLIMVAPNQQHYLAQGLSLLLTFVGHTVVAPVASIGLTLMYFDQRVRKEAFDLEVLLAHTARQGGGDLPADSYHAGQPPENHALL